jgi:hypothetical protein
MNLVVGKRVATLIEWGLLQVTNIKYYYFGQNKSDTVDRRGGLLLTGVKT